MFGMSTMTTGKKRSILSMIRALVTTPWFFTPLSLMNENRGVFGVNMGHLWDESDRVRSWMETLLQWFSEEALAPVVDASFPFDRAAEAHHYIQDRKNLGKVLLVP